MVSLRWDRCRNIGNQCTAIEEKRNSGKITKIVLCVVRRGWSSQFLLKRRKLEREFC